MIDYTAVITRLIDNLPAILTVLSVGYFQWRTGKNRETRTIAANEETKAVATEGLLIGKEVHAVVNGPHTESLRQNAALRTEVERMDAGGAPTPHGLPSAEHPVTMADNVATVGAKP